MKPYKIEDKFLTPEARRAPPGPPFQSKHYNYEAPQSDPWDASNEPDAFSPLMMIQPDAEDVSDVDEPALDAWLAAKANGPALDPDADNDAMRDNDADGDGGYVDMSSFDHIPAYADQLVDEARAEQRQRQMTRRGAR